MVGEKIRKLRKEKKLTLKDIAEATGLSIGYISQLERGAVEPSPVSYTHLDVYKRQALYRSNWASCAVSRMFRTASLAISSSFSDMQSSNCLLYTSRCV